MEATPHSAGSAPAPDNNVPPHKPKLKHIKVFEADHEKITKNVELLRIKFNEKATAEKIAISNKGKGRDLVPSQPEAMEYFFGGYASMDEYVGVLIQRAKAAQAPGGAA